MACADLEQAQWQHLLAHTGATAALAMLPTLSNLQVLAPQALLLEGSERATPWGDEATGTTGDWPTPTLPLECWLGAQVFWNML